MRSLFLLIFFPVAMFAQSPCPVPEIVLRSDDTGKAEATLAFPKTPPPDLTMAEFQPELKGPGIVMDTVRRLDPPDPANKVKLTVTNLIQPGTFTSSLKGTGIDCKITATRAINTYNVKVDASAGNVIFAPDATPVVRLANSDAATYVFTAAILIDGEEKPLNCMVVLPPRGSADISLTSIRTESDRRTGLPEFLHRFGLGFVSRFITSGTLKDDTKKAELILYPAWSDPAMAPRLPLPVTLRRRFFSAGLQEASNLFWIVFFLLLGGVASIWFTFGLPNSQGAIALRRRVAALCAKITGTGEDLSSQWRALICAKLQGIETDIADAAWVFPSFTAQLKTLRTATDMIECWVDIAYRISIVRRGTSELRRCAVPPTVLTWVDDHCENALAPIKTGVTNADEINAMKAEVTAAEQLLAALTGKKAIPELEAEIHKRESRVTAAGSAQDAFSAAFSKGEFDEIVKLTASAAHDIDPDDYVVRDTNSFKLDIAMEMALRRAALKPVALAAAAGNAQPQPLPPRADFTRLLAHWDRTLDYLRPDNYEALRMARTMVWEMYQDIYPEALNDEFVKAENGKAAGIEIRVNISEPKVNEAVRFSLAFSRDVVNSAAACNEMTCTWNFGDNSRLETGWEVFHAFSSEPAANGKFTVTARIFDLTGKEVPNMPLTFPLDVKSRQAAPPAGGLRRWALSPEANLELSRLALVLIVAIAATLAAARDRVQSLSVLYAAGALIGIGFASDQIKKLLSSGDTGQP